MWSSITTKSVDFNAVEFENADESSGNVQVDKSYYSPPGSVKSGVLNIFIFRFVVVKMYLPLFTNSNYDNSIYTIMIEKSI